MKNILITIILISINVCVFAQRMNSRGEYMVKTAIVESYGGRDFSYKLDFEYNDSNDLVKVTRSGYYGNDKYVHVYTLRSGQYDSEKYIYYTGYKNGKVFGINKNKPLCQLSKIYYSLGGKSYNNRFFVVKKDVYDNDNYHETTNYIYLDGKLQAIHRGTNSIDNNEIVILKWTGAHVEKGNIISDRLIGSNSNWHDDFVYYDKSEVINNTNLNINFINMGGVGKTYKDENIGFTEWFGLNTSMALEGSKNDLKHGEAISAHYEYELDGNLIKKVRYIHPIVGKEHNYIYKTLTLEYVY